MIANKSLADLIRRLKRQAPARIFLLLPDGTEEEVGLRADRYRWSTFADFLAKKAWTRLFLADRAGVKFSHEDRPEGLELPEVAGAKLEAQADRRARTFSDRELAIFELLNETRHEALEEFRDTVDMALRSLCKALDAMATRMSDAAAFERSASERYRSALEAEAGAAVALSEGASGGKAKEPSPSERAALGFIEATAKKYGIPFALEMFTGSSPAQAAAAVVEE